MHVMAQNKQPTSFNLPDHMLVMLAINWATVCGIWSLNRPSYLAVSTCNQSLCLPLHDSSPPLTHHPYMNVCGIAKNI